MDEIRRWEMGDPLRVAMGREAERLKAARRGKPVEKVATCAGCRFLLRVLEREVCEFLKKPGRRCGLYRKREGIA